MNKNKIKASANEEQFLSGKVKVHVVADEATLGQRTAAEVVAELKAQRAAAKTPVLWLMAAPSAFSFYQALIRQAGADAQLQSILRETHIFQFDDYPILRSSSQFPATFRYLLQEQLFKPLAGICGELKHIHPLELTGSAADVEIQRRYRDDLLALKGKGGVLIQIKGIGMDGHWGFHGAETPLDAKPGMVVVPMNAQNLRQQMLDWPKLFPTLADVPKQAITFNVGMFLLADRIIDNVPQASKEFAVLATYGTDAVINEVPSSALKRHSNAAAYLTRAVARTLCEFREGRRVDPQYRLNDSARKRLRALWRDEKSPVVEKQNIEIMEQVLRKLGML